MKKTLRLEVEYEDDYVVGERVHDNDKLIFDVYDLTECPEDATICRDLFNAYDYIKAVRYGIELAKQGYDEVEYVKD